MPIMLLDGSVFLHIPKTGGSWVEAVLTDCGLVRENIGGLSPRKHLDFDKTLFREFYGPARGLIPYLGRHFIRRLTGSSEKAAPFTFCFVRHPLKWYESRWKYMRGRGWHNEGRDNSRDAWHPVSVLNGLGSDDFNAFVRNVIRKRPGYVTELYYSYTKHGIGFIGRTEHLVDDLILVLNRIGVAFDEQKIRSHPRVNVSAAVPDPIVWDERLKETVLRLELPAMLHYGYLSVEQAADLGCCLDIPPHPALVDYLKVGATSVHASNEAINAKR